MKSSLNSFPGLSIRFLFAVALATVLFGCAKQPPAVAATPSNADTAKKETPLTPQSGTENAEQNAKNEPATDSAASRPVTPEAPNLDNLLADAAAKKPFRVSIPLEDFPKDTVWLNSAPLRKQDLKGKFVLLDFWTYCCINCIHILPELKKLEKAYPNNLVVIGVHSAKFEGEKDTQNISEAILRYEIEHPVINDADHKIWNSLGVNSWPTVLMIDPEGNAVWGRSGEFKFDQIDALLKSALPYYRENKLLDETPIKFELLAHRQKKTPLRYPGKVLADEKSNRLFISDSNNNRIVVTSLAGELQATIGSGQIGRADGDFATASFDHPQGVAVNGDTLYVADTENHMLRKVDLKNKKVTTISGTGEQARLWPGMGGLRATDPSPSRWAGPPKVTALNSPWDLWIHGKDLYIAMAGPHQIWKMPLDESEISVYAGNGREDIVDGPLVPREPYDEGFSSFAQPSGLSSDGEWLFVADSEGSSIRAVPFDRKKNVRTVVGTAQKPQGRLFIFGDRDGSADRVLFQHLLGVAYHDGKIYVADTYNNKIRVVDAATGDTKTLAGTGKPGSSDADGSFDEPAGLSVAGGKIYVADTNNHAIRIVDLKTGKVSTLAITGLTPPAEVKLTSATNGTTPPVPAKKPSFLNATQVKLDRQSVKAVDGEVRMKLTLKYPAGWKTNPLASWSYYLEADGDAGPIDRSKLGKKTLAKPTATATGEFDVVVPVKGEGEDTAKISMTFYYCEDKGDELGECKFGSVVFTVPLNVSGTATAASVALNHTQK